MSIQKRPDRPKPYLVRVRDASGRQVSKSFRTKKEATTWEANQVAALSKGEFVDPRAGRVRLGDYIGSWLGQQVYDDATRVAVESRMRNHVVPQIGDLPVAAIRPSTIQTWLSGRSDVLAPSTVRVIKANLSSVLQAAIDDGLINSNPMASRSVRPPALDQTRLVPWTMDVVQRIVDAHPARWRAVPMVTVGLGTRQGETFGLRVSDVDFLRGVVHVRQQIKDGRDGAPFAAPPKRRKTRDTPLSEPVAVAVAEHLRRFPASGDDLIFRTRQGGPLTRRYYNRHVWKPAVRAAGIEPTRHTGMHQLRHAFITQLLSQGVNPKAVAEWVGHSDVGYMMRVYGHVLPDDADRARAVIAEAFERVPPLRAVE